MQYFIMEIRGRGFLFFRQKSFRQPFLTERKLHEICRCIVMRLRPEDGQSIFEHVYSMERKQDSPNDIAQVDPHQYDMQMAEFIFECEYGLFFLLPTQGHSRRSPRVAFPNTKRSQRSKILMIYARLIDIISDLLYQQYMTPLMVLANLIDAP
jgi:hypothetical protein